MDTCEFMASCQLPQALCADTCNCSASHVANELIAAGYRVRGTSRDEAKAQTIATEIEKRHGKGVFESAIVSDFGKSGAFSDAIKGS